MPQKNRWHPCLLPDNYQRKLKQDLAETDDAVERTVLDESESEPEQNDE
jgi:hypothetical protein